MEIKRDLYLKKVISSKGNGMIKVITGMRRSGKSYLLFKLFCDHLKETGTDDRHILKIDLENRLNKELRDPDALLRYVSDLVTDDGTYYVLLDEVQMVNEFEDVLNSFLKMGNLDVYVTGSNARFLSKDVITEFRGRGDEIRIRPLSFPEFAAAKHDTAQEQLLNDYLTYGGLPQVTLMENDEKKVDYLQQLFAHTYIRDIKERYGIRKDADLEELIDVVASLVGGLTNPLRIAATFKSVKHSTITPDSIKMYLDMLQDAFLVERSVRYDIKGRRYIGTPSKYYFEDLGLRNARLGFRQTEFPHLLENAIYNELRVRGFSVDVGQVFSDTKGVDGKRVRSALEVDFVCNKGYRRYYVQSAYAMPTTEKYEHELAPLLKIGDSFHKILVTGMPTPTYQNDDGILITNIFDFLMDAEMLV